MPRYLRLFNIIAIAAMFCAALYYSSLPENSRRSGNAGEPAHGHGILLSSTVNVSSTETAVPASAKDVANIFSLSPELIKVVPDASSGQEEKLPFDMFMPIPQLPEPPAVVEEPSVNNDVNNDSRTLRRKLRYRDSWAMVTAYCPCPRCCGRGSPGRTSLGTSAWRPGIAADPRALSYGTSVEVNGYGKYKIDDTGGAMRQSWSRRGILHLDVRMNYHWQARAWGRKLMKVRIYEE